jgi:aminomethyltransferase
MQATALESTHVALGARMVPFAGWNMPVQYRAILDEARTVRTKAGLFDLGHMGRVKVHGRRRRRSCSGCRPTTSPRSRRGASATR